MKTLIAVTIATAACTKAPATPTWQPDIEPVFASNCVRCHGSPGLFGAPTTFRLDVWEDTPDRAHAGLWIRGAGTMSRFSVFRTTDVQSENTPMPPIFPLVGDAKDVILNWGNQAEDPGGALAAGPAPSGARDGNRPPSLALTPLADEGAFAYQIDDADFDLVYGLVYLAADPAKQPVALDLHAGRGTIQLVTGGLAPGSYPMTAILDDGSAPIVFTATGAYASGGMSMPAGTLVVQHAGGARPSLSFSAPLPFQILNTNVLGKNSFDITLAIADVDDPKPAVTLQAIYQGDSTVAPIDITVGDSSKPIAWDLTGVKDGDWKLVATTARGDTFSSEVFVVSHSTTALRFQDVQGILRTHCAPCHSDCPAVPNVLEDFTRYSAATGNPLSVCTVALEGVHDGNGGNNPGLIYDRVFRRYSDPPLVDPTISDSDRATLAEWLLAGATDP